MFRRLTIPFLAALALSAVPGSAQCPRNVTAVRYHPVNGSQPAVLVSVNGHGPWDFIVDTGAGITVIEPSLAAELQLRPQSQIGVIAVAAAPQRADIVVPEQIELGSLVVRRLPVAVQSLRQIQAFQSHVRGILGGNFLSRFSLLIDYEHRRLCLDETGQMQQTLQGERIPLLSATPQTGQLAWPPPRIPVRLAADKNAPTILLVDSGANLPVLYSPRLRPAWWQQWNHARQSMALGHDTILRFAALPAQGLTIGKSIQRQIAFMALVSTGETLPALEDDGLLPTSLFRKVFISYPDRFLIFEPR